MNSHKNGVIMGTISCIADTTMHKESRIEMHRKQLDFLEKINQTMVEKYNAEPLPYFRVEQGWEPETQKRLTTTLPMTSIKYDKPIPPGAARNELLKKLYESDADWLICMDDDHGLYDHYDGFKLMWDIEEEPFINQLCKQGFIITSFPAYWDGFKAEVDKYGKAEESWLFKTTRHPGAMPFCCIPNIKKYRNREVWFDDQAMNNSIEDLPEDLKFQFDWIRAGGRVVECMMFIGKSWGNMQHSTLFKGEAARKEIYQSNEAWASSYLKTLYPRKPELWTTRGFLNRKNPKCVITIPRVKREVLQNEC